MTEVTVYRFSSVEEREQKGIQAIQNITGSTTSARDLLKMANTIAIEGGAVAYAINGKEVMLHEAMSALGASYHQSSDHFFDERGLI